VHWAVVRIHITSVLPETNIIVSGVKVRSHIRCAIRRCASLVELVATSCRCAFGTHVNCNVFLWVHTNITLRCDGLVKT